MKAESAADTEISVRVFGDDAAGELRSLLHWLDGDDAMRGRIRAAGGPPSPGQMGAGVESLVLMLAPGGVATACATVLIAWIRSRSGAISIEVSRPDGARMRLDAKNTSQIPHERIDELAARMSALLGGDAETAGTPHGGAPPGGTTGQ